MNEMSGDEMTEIAIIVLLLAAMIAGIIWIGEILRE